MKQTLNRDQVDRLTDLVRRKTGMIIESNKRVLLETYIHDRLGALQISSLEEYCDRLGGAELEELINAVLINETLFFRYPSQMRILQDDIFPRMIRERQSARLNAPIRIWSAGCSTGAEAFSVVMAFEESRRNAAPDIAVLATDISTKALNIASAGVYPSRPVEHAPDHIIKRYFVREPGGGAEAQRHYRVRDEIRKRVTFQTHNLTDQQYPGGFDLIFCCNVLIYLNADVRQHMVERFYHSLKNGGILVVGHSENLLDWPDLFQAHFKDDAIYYEKRTPAAASTPSTAPSPVKQAPARLAADDRRPAVELIRKEDEICLTLTGCLDADLYPSLPEDLKHKLAGLVQDGHDDVRALRIHLKDVTYISPEIPAILRRGAILAGDGQLRFTIDVEDGTVGQFLERHGIQISHGRS